VSRWSYFARRILLAIPVLIFGVSMTFLLLRLSPLDPVNAILGQNAANDPAAVRNVKIEVGLIRPNGEPIPLWEQYITYMTDLFTLNFGEGQVGVDSGTPVMESITSRMDATIFLGFWSVVIALFIGIPVGFYAGLNPNTYGDYAASFGGIVWRAMPNFWLAIILVGLIVKGGQFDWWQGFLVETDRVVKFGPQDLHTVDGFLRSTKLFLPAAVVLGSSSMGNEVRIGRTAVLENINSKYVETARAKGVSNRKIVWKHVFRNALIPLVPIITGEFLLLIGGSVIIEEVFAINGLGRLFLTSALEADLNVLGALSFIFITIGLAINIFQDFLYTVIDPRVGYESN
jgi:peptide/nickel transport system permease protein